MKYIHHKILGCSSFLLIKYYCHLDLYIQHLPLYILWTYMFKFI